MSGNSGRRKLTYPAVILRGFGIGVRWVRTNDPEEFRNAIDEKTKAVYMESVSNPSCNVPDIAKIAKVDNLTIRQPWSRLTGEHLGCS